MDAIEQSVEIPAGGAALEAEIAVPVPSRGMVLLVHGESPDHDHPWIGRVAVALQDAGLATTVLGLLAAAEERIDASDPVSSDIHPLEERVIAAADWLVEHEFAPGPDIGLFGAGVGAAAALIAASAWASVAAIVVCGSRTDLAAELLERVRQPTLVIVGEDDWATVGLDRLALARTGGEAHLEVFSGDLDEAARSARDWFVRHLRTTAPAATASATPAPSPGSSPTSFAEAAVRQCRGGELRDRGVSRAGTGPIIERPDRGHSRAPLGSRELSIDEGGASNIMAVKLNEKAFEHGKDLIKAGRYVLDNRDDWSEHQPTADQENRFIEEHGFAEYARWYLGVDDEEPEDTKGRYRFPYGDFEKVHRCGLLAAESRAGQRKYYDIELAVAHLHGMLDALR